MSKWIRYREEFKKGAVSQFADRGYLVKEVSNRLGISTKSLYDWIKQYSNPESLRVKETE
jgi:transposase